MSKIQLEYVNYKNIMSRNAFQIVLETDAANALQVLEALGMPNSHASKMVEVALLRGDEG